MIFKKIRWDKKCRNTVVFAVLLGFLYLLYSCVLLPLSISVGSNVAYAGTMVLDLLELFYEVVDIAAFFWAYAVMIQFVFRYGPGGTLPIVMIYAGADFLRYCMNLVISIQMSGDTSDLLGDILFVLLYWTLEMVQFLGLFALTSWFWKRWIRISAVVDQAEKRLGRPVERENLQLYPFRRVWNWGNPLQRSAACAGILMTATRWINRIIYDIGYGAPADVTDALWMILYYFSDALIGVVGYFVILWILRIFNKSDSSAI